jgi:hypothetical protein
MRNEPSYEDLAEAIAHCVFEEIYFEEGGVMAVDNMTSSGFQIPTGVLNRLDVLVPLDDLARRNDFTCEPHEFREKIIQNKFKGCSYDTLVLALICLLDYHPNVKAVYDVLTRLGVVEPDTDPPYDKGENWPDDSKIRWTEKKDQYWDLYKKWVELLESSQHDEPRL